MQDFAKSFRAARRVSTPLVCVRTPDPASTVRAIMATLNGAAESTPAILWDICNGIVGVNQKGKDETERLLDSGDPAKITGRPSDMLIRARVENRDGSGKDYLEDMILFMSNAHKYWTNEVVVQGVYNLRDPYKAGGKMLVMLATLGATLPAELAQDVLLLDEPLPNAEQLKAIVKDTYKAANGDKEPGQDTSDKAVDALVGLAAFPAEQTFAMATTSKGVDTDDLWERKRKVIEQVRGLTVWRGGETFADLGGLQNSKAYFSQLLRGPAAPDGLVFQDEIEKSFAGFGTDSSGSTTKQMGTLLSYMEDKGITGSLFIGPPGAGKSALAKALGNEAGVPTVQADFAAMEGSLVGQSNENTRAALSIIDAMFKRPLFIATCNSIGSLPPELRRRYRLASFFFDLPTVEERATIWPIYLKRYKLEGQKLPPDKGWTGAEIRNCCDTAWRLGCTLEEASCYVVPVAVSAEEVIRKLRKDAHNKFVSASNPGLFQYREEAASVPQNTRKIRPTGQA